MANIIRKPSWHIPKHLITSEEAFFNRRAFLAQLGMATGGLLSLPHLQAADSSSESSTKSVFPARRNPKYDPGLDLTDENVASRYNNFYEFTLVKNQVHRMVDRFVIDPWPIEITGLIENPFTLDLKDLLREFPQEERVYRFRCVEAWSMVVPWTGFQLSELIKKAKPKAEAKFIRFETFNRPTQAPGMLEDSYPWPYFEGLRMDEAMHPLTLLTTGIYGKALPKQHGAPIRLIVPWKYGYKSIKSIVKIEFVAKQPKTFWESLAANEYPFESNVDPKIPHPRWSQATERVIDTGRRLRTKPYNGYAEEVEFLYKKG